MNIELLPPKIEITFPPSIDVPIMQNLGITIKKSNETIADDNSSEPIKFKVGEVSSPFKMQSNNETSPSSMLVVTFVISVENPRKYRRPWQESGSVKKKKAESKKLVVNHGLSYVLERNYSK